MELTTDRLDFNSTMELIRTRRTVRTFSDRTVEDSTLSDIIEAATWAPNHRMTEPWRFYVLAKGGEARQKVADLTSEWVKRNTPNRNQAEASALSAHRELTDAPALVYVYSIGGGSPEIDEENYSATSCAVQNLMLAAHSAGLGVGWSTGKPTRHPQLPEVLGADEGSKIVGCLYIGYPRETPASHRQGVGTVATWI